MYFHKICKETGCLSLRFLKRDLKLFKSQAVKNSEFVPDPTKNILIQWLWGWIPGGLYLFPSFFFSCHQVILIHSQVWKSLMKDHRLISLMSPWHLGSISFWSSATIDWDINHTTLCSLEKADNWQHSLPHCSDESHNPLCRVINYPFVCTGCSDIVLFNEEGREFGHNINSC